MVNDVEVYFTGVNYDSKVFSYKIVEKLNQVPYFECKLVDVATSDAYVKQSGWFSVKYDGAYVFPKFFVDEVKKETDLFIIARGVGFVERMLSNFSVDLAGSYSDGSSSLRVQYNDKTPDEIVGWQLGLYTTGVTKGTCLNSATDDINIRSEKDTLNSFFYGIGNISNTDCFASYSSDLSTSSINITNRGSDKTATVVFNISGINQNIDDSTNTLAFEELCNVCFVGGYGDGINQLVSKSFHATSIRTKLASSVTDSQNTLPLVDASGFGVSGSVWVGCEKCSYTGKSTNTLTGVTRGVAFQGSVKKAYAHSVNSPVYDAQYTESSPQSSGNGASINSNGIKHIQFEAKDIIDQSTLDIVCEKILLERKGTGVNYTPPEIITFVPSDYLFAVENVFVGDIVTIIDADTGLNGGYRVVSKILSYPEDGVPFVELQCSNSVYSLLSDIVDDSNKGVTLSKYMQGATNIFSINETDNVESGTDDYLGLTMFFNIPEDAVAINSVKLSYRNEAPKTWSSNTSSGGGSTSGSGGGSTVTSGSGGGTTATSGSNSESTMQSGSSSFLSSISTNTTSWQNVTTLTATTSAYSIVSCACSIQLASTNREYDSNPMNSDYIAYRLYDGSSYYPNSDGVRIPLNFGWSHHHYDSGSSGGYVHGTPLTTGTSFFANGAGAIIYPKNTSGKTVKLQVALNRSISSSYAYINYAYQVLSNHTHDVTLSNHTHSVTVANHTHSTPNHTHTIAYDLAQQTYTTTDIRIWTTDDASGTPTWTERTSDIETVLGRALSSGNNQSEIDLSLTSYFWSTGWKGIKITTNGNSRIKGQAIVKCYIQSRLVD